MNKEKSETQESNEVKLKPKYPDEKNGDNKQNNANLYLVLKEGYTITLPKVKKDNRFYKCVKIEEDDEVIDLDGIQQLGKEFDEMINIKIKKTGNDKEIELTPKDLFDDGDGVEIEKIESDEKKEGGNLPSPFA